MNSLNAIYALNVFKNGLNSELKPTVFASRRKDLNEAFQLCSELEDDFSSGSDQVLYFSNNRNNQNIYRNNRQNSYNQTRNSRYNQNNQQYSNNQNNQQYSNNQNR